MKDIKILSKFDDLGKNLKLINYPYQIDDYLLKAGDPRPFLQILHYCFQVFSPAIAQELNDNEYNLFAASDKDFINGIFLALKFLYDYTTPLSTKNFFEVGHMEKKINLINDVIPLIRVRAKKLESAAKTEEVEEDTFGHFYTAFKHTQKLEEPNEEIKPPIQERKYQSMRNPIPGKFEMEKSNKTEKIMAAQYNSVSSKEAVPFENLTKSKDKHLILVESMNLLSETVTAMVSKFDDFTTKIHKRFDAIENRFENLESEVSLLKNRMNLMEGPGQTEENEEPMFSFGNNFRKSDTKPTNVLSNAISKFENLQKMLSESEKSG